MYSLEFGASFISCTLFHHRLTLYCCRLLSGCQQKLITNVIVPLIHYGGVSNLNKLEGKSVWSALNRDIWHQRLDNCSTRVRTTL